ncbi:MAG: hypothetical protein SVY53_05230 [Chloroflexota bacterium]|nr:hypothetical protein [Chloroflexota bacterium]
MGNCHKCGINFVNEDIYGGLYCPRCVAERNSPIKKIRELEKRIAELEKREE